MENASYIAGPLWLAPVTYGSLQNSIWNYGKTMVLWLLLSCVILSSLGNDKQEQGSLWNRLSCSITHSLSAFQSHKHQKKQRSHFHYKSKFSGSVFKSKQRCMAFWIIFRKSVWEFQREEESLIILCLAWELACKCLKSEQTRANASPCLVTTECPTSSSASVKGLCCDGGDNIFPCSVGSEWGLCLVVWLLGCHSLKCYRFHLLLWSVQSLGVGWADFAAL